MPGDRLPFPVRVGGEIHSIRFGGFFTQFTNEGGLAGNIHIPRLESVFDIHAEQGLRKIPDMSHRRNHLIARAQVFLNSFGLCRRFHDHKSGHSGGLLSEGENGV